MAYNWRVLFVFSISILFSCDGDDVETGTPLLKAEEGEEFSGGDFTIFNTSFNAFDFEAPVLSIPERQRFGIGDSFFDLNWVTAPASTTARDGLGPFFNARACASCHPRDGRGKPPTTNGGFANGLLLQLSNGSNSLINGPQPHPIYGNQLQDQSILGLTTEGRFRIEYTSIPGSYADGTIYELRKPNYIIEDLAYGDLENFSFSPRVATQVIGMGLLETITETDILINQDISDNNGDGISGKANFVWNIETQATMIGRFGWKANQPTLNQQNASAFHGDLGITNSIFFHENCPQGVDCTSIPNGGTPEITQNNLENVRFYTSTLAIPGRRNWEEQNVLRGKKLFNEMKCTSCHIPQFKTGVSNFVSRLSNQTIRPYSDLLLHDMGEGLADGFNQFLANGREWRTSPLWGIGLIETVNGHTNFLHDGRARNLEEAILWHGGEAENSRESFKNLTINERQNLIDFLNSL